MLSLLLPMCMLANVHHEARGEPFIGRAMVAATVYNRAISARTDLCTEVYRKNQYSWTRSEALVAEANTLKTYNPEIARAVVLGALVATVLPDLRSFHTTTIKPPVWTKKLGGKTKVGGHYFYLGRGADKRIADALVTTLIIKGIL